PRGVDNRPAEINAAVIARARRDLGVSGLPVIFDLPPAVAVKRAEQFARDVHPVLQAACVKCHNEQHSGTFQLVEVKLRRGPSGEVLRANLDATLRLVDPENPARSELLSSALVPHGNRPSPRPIFRGSNDPRYQILAAWVNSLRVNRPAEAVVPTRYAPTKEAAGGEGFAVERAAGQGAAPGVTTTAVTNQPRLVPGLDRKEVLEPSRYVPGQGMVAERNAPPAGEFPVPYMLGGPRPRPNNGVANPSPLPPPAAPSVPSTPIPTEPLPTRTESSTEPAPAPAEAPAATARPKKPLKIDADLLQKAILNRNSGR
ncbi:MAG: hypothetical protein LC745_10635, partial [Planctomycetia bacterium]|nr:hypothetical protein [Planctomycetia bacterium]